MAGKHKTDSTQNEARQEGLRPPTREWLGINHAFNFAVMGEIPVYFQKKWPRQGKYNYTRKRSWEITLNSSSLAIV